MLTRRSPRCHPVALPCAVRVTTRGISSPNEICPATANPCRIDSGGLLPVANGAVLDFGSRTLEVVRGGLDAGTGTVTIHAGAVVVRSHGRLHAVSVTDSGGTVQIAEDGAITVGAGDDGEIDVSGTSGGTIGLRAGGPIAIMGQLHAMGQAEDGDAGAIEFAASAVITGAGAKIAATSGRFVRVKGDSGATVLRADAALTMAGRLQAGTENGLVTSGRGSAPLVTGTITPTPVRAVATSLDGLRTEARPVP